MTIENLGGALVSIVQACVSQHTPGYPSVAETMYRRLVSHGPTDAIAFLKNDLKKCTVFKRKQKSLILDMIAVTHCVERVFLYKDRSFVLIREYDGPMKPEIAFIY